MPLPFHRRRLDPDAADFCRRSGANDRAAINAFVRGVKDLGLWDKMVCWPLRSSQNAGFGSTAYSLGGLGTYDGTLVNAPGWTADGIAFVSTSLQAITTELNSQFADFGAMAVANISGSSPNFSRIIDKSFITGFWIGADSVANQVRSGVQEAGAPYGRAVALLDDTYNAVFSTRSGVTHSLYGNGSSISATGTVTDAALSSTKVTLGRNATTATDYLQGTISFGLVCNAALAASQVDSLYALYRTTLGTGLGLP